MKRLEIQLATVDEGKSNFVFTLKNLKKFFNKRVLVFVVVLTLLFPDLLLNQRAALAIA